MQKLLEPNTVPPGGFRYLQSETRTWITAPDYDELFLRVKQHRQANNVPLDQFWREKVEDQICQMMPPGTCKEEPNSLGEVRNIINRLSWNDVYNGTTTFAHWAFKGFPKVDQQKAGERGDVCSRCYFNVAVSDTCGACGHLQNLASAFTQGRVTPSDSFLKACAVCKCSLRVKVWVPIETIAAGTPNTDLPRYPDFCWIRKEVQEYRNKTLHVEQSL